MSAFPIWKTYGYRPFQDGWTTERPAHEGGEDSAEFRAIPVEEYDALVRRASDGDGFLNSIRLYAKRLGVDTTREGDEPGQIQVLNAIDALLAARASAPLGREGAKS